MLLTSVLFQTNKFKCISVHGDSHLQTQETLLAAYHCTAGSSSKPQSSLLLHCTFTAHNWALQAQLPVPYRGLSFAWHPTLQGAGSDLPLPPTTIHNIPVLAETVSQLGHTKAEALFGNKLLKRSWEQPQTAALQLDLKHSLSLAFLSATSTRQEAFWGNPLRLGWDRWPTGYTITTLYGVLHRGRMEPEVVFKLWTLIILKSFQPCCKGGLCAAVCWRNFWALLFPWGWNGADWAVPQHPTSSCGHLPSQTVCTLPLMPGTHFSHHSTHARFNEDIHHTWKEVTERKGWII